MNQDEKLYVCGKQNPVTGEYLSLTPYDKEYIELQEWKINIKYHSSKKHTKKCYDIIHISSDCIICLSSITEGVIVNLKKCSHVFHKECIDKALKNKRIVQFAGNRGKKMIIDLDRTCIKENPVMPT